MSTTIRMPKYKCHKEVWALKIQHVTGVNINGNMILYFESPYAPIEVDSDYVNKHAPAPGGYFVIYKDGYRSWSPADVFEEGYTLVEEEG